MKVRSCWKIFGKYASAVVVISVPSEKIYQIRFNGSSTNDIFFSECPIYVQCLFTRNKKETFLNRKTWRSKSPNSLEIISAIKKLGINSNTIKKNIAMYACTPFTGSSLPPPQVRADMQLCQKHPCKVTQKPASFTFIFRCSWTDPTPRQ